MSLDVGGVSGDGVLELPHADPERAADLRETLRSEEQQGENQEKDQVSRCKKSRSHALDRTTVIPALRDANSRLYACKSVRSACGHPAARAGYDGGVPALAAGTPDRGVEGRSAWKAHSYEEFAWHCWS